MYRMRGVVFPLPYTPSRCGAWAHTSNSFLDAQTQGCTNFPKMVTQLQMFTLHKGDVKKGKH